jgi:hypothetical protein
MPDFDAIVSGLRCEVQHQSRYVKAAVELLIEHGTWIRRRDFERACMSHYPNERTVRIDWRKARMFAEAAPPGSTMEMAVLDLAVALGENRFRFSSMGPGHALLARRAVARALGDEVT